MMAGDGVLDLVNDSRHDDEYEIWSESGVARELIVNRGKKHSS